jgi:holin-like protein
MLALKGLTWLLVLQSIGEALSRVAHVPLPGPVIGLLLLAPALGLGFVRTPVAAAADMLLAHLSLLFVPVGVGVMTHLGLIGEYGLRMLGVVAISTWVGLAVTALVLGRFLRDRDGSGGDAAADADGAPRGRAPR